MKYDSNLVSGSMGSKVCHLSYTITHQILFPRWLRFKQFGYEVSLISEACYQEAEHRYSSDLLRLWKQSFVREN